MKRATGLWPQIVTPDNLRYAAWKAGKGKRNAAGTRAFFAGLDQQITDLYHHLLEERMDFGDYRYFMVYEPKPRRIAAPAFREQVVHHALMNACDPWFEQKQIFDSYASRRGKGVFAVLERAQLFQRRYRWALKLDVRDFFGSIHHPTAKEQMDNLFKERKVQRLFSRIIDSFNRTEQRGLPIGTLTSQYLANHYLCGLDHFVKEQLGCSAYVRYMDDMVLWHNDKNYLTGACRQITDYVKTLLKQTLKPPLLQATARGLPFLGFVLYPHYRRLTRQSKRRLVKRATARYREVQLGLVTEEAAARRTQSLLAFTDWADANYLRRTLFTRLAAQYGDYA